MEKVYVSEYENYNLYVASFTSNAKAFFYEKTERQWYNARVVYADDDYHEDSVCDVIGEFVTDHVIYCVGLKILEKINKPSLTAIGYS